MKADGHNFYSFWMRVTLRRGKYRNNFCQIKKSSSEEKLIAETNLVTDMAQPNRVYFRK
jgi:hypothetical protein